MKTKKYQALPAWVIFILLCPALLAATRITVTSPTAADEWAMGSAVSIRWTHSGFTDPGAQKVAIRLRQGNRLVCAIADGVELTDGRYSWTVGAAPCAGIEVGRYYIRVRTRDGETGDSPEFTLSAGTALLRLESPNGGESWEFGTQRTIRWTAIGVAQTIELKLFKDGVFKADIAHDWLAVNQPPSTGICPWRVGRDRHGRGAGTGPGYSIRVSTLDGRLSDDSDRSFEIGLPSGSGLQAASLAMDAAMSCAMYYWAPLTGWLIGPSPKLGNIWMSDRNAEAVIKGLLTYDLTPLPRDITIESAHMDLSDHNVDGDPFHKLGSVVIEAIEYERITKPLFSSIGAELYSRTGAPGRIDVSERVRLLHASGRSRFQCKVFFSHPADGDHQNDCVTLKFWNSPLIIKYSRNPAH